MNESNRVNLFTGWPKEGQRRLIRDLNNITPSELSFDELIEELNNA